MFNKKINSKHKLVVGIIVFAIIAAASMALLEVQIEGKNAGASALPTEEIDNEILTMLVGGMSLTWYHVYARLAVLIMPHAMFFFGVPWSRKMEAAILSSLCFIAPLEHFFWVLFNPYYGLQAFNSANTQFSWLGPVPAFYWICGAIGTIFLLLAIYLPKSK